ncbi:MAG: S41 family peptidase [Steroidobacteraceae bacterium]|jgi:carboxyl-terminal processing protease|nr:S41 family peptidase [Steroidobacteraceae bacterium]
MKRPQTTFMMLVIGAALGFALAVSGGVLAQREPAAKALPWEDARLLAEVIARIRSEYVDPVGDHELMQQAVRGMVSGLDAHSTFLDEGEVEDLRIATEGNYSGIGIEVSYESGRIVVVAPIEGSPADRAGLRSGDVIVEIDGRKVDTRSLADAIGRMRGEPGTVVRLAVEREEEAGPLEFTIGRAHVEVVSVRAQLISPGYGYVRLAQFSGNTATELEAAVTALQRGGSEALEGLVLDLRGNPGGVLEAGVAVADAFLDRGLIVSAEGRTREARFRMEATPGQLAPAARIAVLVDGGSASASEIVAGALRDHGRAVLIGRQTYGKGSVQTVLPLSAGQAIKLTTSRYYTPSGASIHEKGLRPDIELAEDAAGARRPAAGATTRDAPLAERDEGVRVALDWLKGPAAVRMAGRGAAG